MSIVVVQTCSNIVLGVFMRLSAEWDALSASVQRKLITDLQAAIRARQTLDGSVKVANERPFNDQAGAEEDFLSWKPPLLVRLREANEVNNPLYVSEDLPPSRQATLSPSPPSPLVVVSFRNDRITPTTVVLSPAKSPPTREEISESQLLPATLMASFPLPPSEVLEDTQVLSQASST
jgi:hypothetical protein